jgi:hypothetical protein
MQVLRLMAGRSHFTGGMWRKSAHALPASANCHYRNFSLTDGLRNACHYNAFTSNTHNDTPTLSNPRQ